MRQLDEQEIFESGSRNERDMVLGDDADYAFSPQMGFLKIDRQRMEWKHAAPRSMHRRYGSAEDPGPGNNGNPWHPLWNA